MLGSISRKSGWVKSLADLLLFLLPGLCIFPCPPGTLLMEQRRWPGELVDVDVGHGFGDDSVLGVGDDPDIHLSGVECEPCQSGAVDLEGVPGSVDLPVLDLQA